MSGGFGRADCRSPSGCAISGSMPDQKAATEEAAVTGLRQSLERSGEIEVAQRERLAAVGRVAATIAHDLGTPLNSVLGYTQLLMLGELDDDRREKLAIIESQVRRMIETIQHVLDRTRGHEIPRQEVDVPEVVEDVRATLAASAEAEQVELAVEIEDDLPSMQSDAIAIRQILVNLLNNAIEATAAGGQVTMRAFRDRDGEAGDGVVLEVADNGPGVPDEQRAAVFEPFYTTKGSQGGTGLGLAIVQWLARELGGSVAVDGDRSGGAIFRVRLPLE
jgi:signal transduction histidine kinase